MPAYHLRCWPSCSALSAQVHGTGCSTPTTNQRHRSSPTCSSWVAAAVAIVAAAAVATATAAAVRTQPML